MVSVVEGIDVERAERENRSPSDDMNLSPFHLGERDLQERAGVRERMEKFGRRVIRDHFPEQHRSFYQQLPFLLLGYSDSDGWPWVSLQAGTPGFIRSPNNRTLKISTPLMSGDPLKSSLQTELPVGGLGLEPHTRRRNRFSMQVAEWGEKDLTLTVRQTFGNCPQYIRNHRLEYSPIDEPGATEVLSSLDDEAIQLIRSSDTFFVSSQTLDDEGLSAGADVSHRGGKSGFVQVEQSHGGYTLTIPDYPGNNHFNTLGNFLLNPRAGLLFWDIDRQDVLMMTGDVQILNEHPLLPFFEGADRFWQLRVHKAIRLKGQLPLRGQLGDHSPNTLMTGDWRSAQQAFSAHQQRHSFQSYEVIGRVAESDQVVSLYLKPQSASLPSFIAGQFLTVKMPMLKDDKGRDIIRTYTVSNAPNEGSYRISVKRIEGDDQRLGGIVSNYLHDSISIGDCVQAKAPQGLFHWQEDSYRDVVMLAAGIGITPMISMIRHALREQLRTRRFQNITLVVVSRNLEQKIFRDEIGHLLKAAQGYLRVCWCLTEPEGTAVKGRDYQVDGRPDEALLQSLLPLADYDFYLCGPGLFMQDMHDVLLGLGVSGQRIFSESFGPSSMTPVSPVAVVESENNAPVAESAGVRLLANDGQEHFELGWDKSDGSLLEFIEGHGVVPVSGCRNGRCGSCAADLIDGDVVYDHGCSAPQEGGVLLCCSRPAMGKDLLIKLREES